MSAKISALPVATDFSSTDVICGLRSGADVQISRGVFLSAIAGQSISLLGNGGAVVVATDGSVASVVPSASQYSVVWSGLNAIFINGSGYLTITAFPGSGIAIVANGGQVTFDALGGIQLSPAAGQVVSYGYTPANPGDWVVPPTDLAIAVDRIARVVSALGTIPIP